MSTEFSTDLIPYGSPTPGPPRNQFALNPVRMLRLRAPLMLLVFFLVAVPSVVAVWTLTPQQYTASDRLQFASKDTRILYRPVPGDAFNVNYDKYVGNYASLVTDAAFLSRVVIEPKVRDLALIRELPPEKQLQFLQDSLSVRRIPNTELLQISATLSDAEAARVIVDAAVTQMEEAALREQEAARRRVDDTLRKEEQRLQERYDHLLRLVEGMHNTMESPHLDLPGFVGGSMLEVELSRSRQSLKDAQAGLEAAQKRRDQLAQIEEELEKNPGKPIYQFDIERRAGEDPKVQALRSREIAIDNSIQTSPYVPGHERLRQQEDQLKQVREALANAMAAARRNVVRATVNQAALEIDAAQSLVNGRDQNVKELEALVAQEKQSAGERVLAKDKLESLQQEKERVREQLQATQEKIRQAEVEEEDAPARVSRPSDGFVSVRPDDSKRYKLALLASIGAAGLAFAAGFLREITDKQLHSSEDLSYITPLPVLASIPHTSTDRVTQASSAAMLARDHPHSPTTEEFRRILARIIYPPEGAVEMKTILVTSPSRGDGKTSLVCNLGIALAQADRRVLLVDISARRPGLERSFDLEIEAGLGEILSGECVAEEVIRATEVPNLYVLGPGFQDRDVTGKLASRDAVEFFEEAEHAFDHVIIDTPPWLLMSDAKLLAPVMDGVIMVVGVGSSTSGMTRRCLQEMQTCGAHVMGVVLNGVRATRGGYLQRNRDAYYAYADEENGNGRRGHRNGASASGAPHAGDEELPMILLVDDRPDSGQDPDRE